ncbi:MAG: endo-1,4-beta-xylanase [Bdellovibrionales bacterium]|nr:endo-1,4-beta-xylanase [Bdellovibrionales bacterium]
MSSFLSPATDWTVSRRDFLKALGLSASTLALPPTALLAREAELPLAARAAAKGILYGSEIMMSSIEENPALAEHYREECALFVPGNELKWHIIRRMRGEYDFKPADMLFRFAEDCKALVRGHTLIWGESLPRWFSETATKANAGRLLEEHVTTVASRYAGRVHSWDVVNEPIRIWDQEADGMTSNIWLKLLGPDFVRTAFEAAAKADPHARLVLNQNYLEYDSHRFGGFRRQTLRLLEKLLSEKTPLHALGIQGHLRSDHGVFNRKSFREFIREVADLGLEIYITELDVWDGNLPANERERDRLVAEQYRKFLETALDEPAVTLVATWGLCDRYSWYVDHAPRADGLAVRPLPLDRTFRRKPAWDAMGKAFDSAAMRKRAKSFSIRS